MFIRYQVARNLALVVATGGLFAYCARDEPQLPLTDPSAQRLGAQTVATGPLVDAVLIAAADSPVSGGKTKDALAGRNIVKLNLYDDNGDGVADRAKVDRNRDDVWDESWTRKNNVWERGDGTVWLNGAWSVPGGATPVAGDAPSRAPVLTGVEAVQADVVKQLLEGTATSEKIKDFTRGRGPKFNLYDDDKDGRWDRAKADYDRDDTWDESWTRKGGTVERKDEKTGKILIYEGGVWLAK